MHAAPAQHPVLLRGVHLHSRAPLRSHTCARRSVLGCRAAAMSTRHAAAMGSSGGLCCRSRQRLRYDAAASVLCPRVIVASVQAPAASAAVYCCQALLQGAAAAPPPPGHYQHVVWFRRRARHRPAWNTHETPLHGSTNTVWTNAACNTSHAALLRPANVPPRAGAAASWWSAATFVGPARAKASRGASQTRHGRWAGLRRPEP